MFDNSEATPARESIGTMILCLIGQGMFMTAIAAILLCLPAVVGG